MKHTPGPWKFEKMKGFDDLHKLKGTTPESHEGYFRTNDGSFAVTTEEGRIAVIDFQGKAKRGEAWRADDPEGIANAHLISAAPELLHACKDIMDFLRSHGYDTTLVKAAIAKAEPVK